MSRTERGATTAAGAGDELNVLVVGTFGGGGIHSYIDEQVNQLDGLVRVRTHDMRAPPVGSGRLRAVQGLLLGLVAFVQFLFRRPADVVHVHTSHRFSFYRASPYVFFARYVWRRPVVLHVHGSAFDDFVLTRSQAVGALQQLVFRASDEVIVLSEYWKDLVSHRVEREKIRVIPNAVRPDVFPVDDERTTPHVVFVSNLIERKGVLELVSAVERLSDRASGDFEVTIAGDGPLSASVERLADEYDEVTYLGYVSEERKRTLLRDGSIYVLPTYAEGLPIALLEGMAGGNAVVSTAVGSIPEVIDECNGILVEPGEVDELADALAELITDRDRRARMAERNRELIETRYSWDRVRTELVNAYRSNTGS